MRTWLNVLLVKLTALATVTTEEPTGAGPYRQTFVRAQRISIRAAAGRILDAMEGNRTYQVAVTCFSLGLLMMCHFWCIYFGQHGQMPATASGGPTMLELYGLAGLCEVSRWWDFLLFPLVMTACGVLFYRTRSGLVATFVGIQATLAVLYGFDHGMVAGLAVVACTWWKIFGVPLTGLLVMVAYGAILHLTVAATKKLGRFILSCPHRLARGFDSIIRPPWADEQTQQAITTITRRGFLCYPRF